MSTREKDWMDIEQVISNQRDQTDWSYLLKHCKDLSEFLDDPGIYDRVKNWKDEGKI